MADPMSTIGVVNADNAPPRLAVDVRAAAALLSISERTLFSLTKSGAIPCVRIGRSVRYSIESLRGWLAQQETQTE